MPGSRDDVRAMLERQRAQLDHLELAQRRRLYALLEAQRRELLDKLASVGADTFTAQHYRVALARVNETIMGLVGDVRSGLDAGAVDAYRLANQHLVNQIARFSGQFEGIVRSTNWKPLLALDDQVLLDRHDASARAYGADLRRRIQGRMAEGLIREEPWSQTVRDLAGKNGLLAQDYYGMSSADSHRQSRAERIVRTELANAYNRAHNQDLLRANAEDPGYQKTLASTFDHRTGSDSISVHAQVRDLDKPFEDNQGRSYQHPPNRPNDREVELPWRPEWGSRAALTPAPASSPPAASSGQAPLVAMAGRDDLSRRFPSLPQEERRRVKEEGTAWATGLAQPSRQAIELFTSKKGHYKRMRALHQGGLPSNATGQDRALLRAVEVAQSAIASAPIVRGTVFRGHRGSSFHDANGASVSQVAGTVFSWGALTSGTLDMGAAVGGFSNDAGIVFIIRNKSGRYIAPAAAAASRGQEEVLFPKGTKYRIIDVQDRVSLPREMKGGARETVNRRVMYIEEIGQ